MAIKFANNATTTIASGIVSTDTSITVVGSSGGLFPSAGGADYFYATLNNAANDIEIVKVTARSGDVMTVLRGQDGTVALDWIGGDKFELRLTAKAVSDVSEGVNITDLDGVDIGQSDPGDGTFVDLEAQSLDVSGAATFGGSVALGSSATATTQNNSDNSTKVATTAYVDRLVNLNSWSIVESSGIIYFKYNGSNKMRLDSSGNLTVSGNITAYGTV